MIFDVKIGVPIGKMHRVARVLIALHLLTGWQLHGVFTDNPLCCMIMIFIMKKN